MFWFYQHTCKARILDLFTVDMIHAANAYNPAGHATNRLAASWYR